MAADVPAEMTVVEIREPGAPGVLTVVQRPVPRPGASEVLVQVAAAGVNGPDIVQRKGLYPPPPGASDLPGLEIAGTVVARGERAERWSIGDRVCALTNGGGYAAFCAVEAAHCLPLPGGLGPVEAASLPETFFTVWSNLFLGRRIERGQVLLVHGGAGGIGSTAIQLGQAFGLRVFATAGSEERARFCAELGARAINYRREDFVEVVRAETEGADLILDIVGGPYIERNFKAAAPDARIVQLAFAQGAKLEVNLMPVMLKRLVFTGSTLRSRPAVFKSAVAREVEEHVWPLFAERRLRPVVERTYPLAQAAEAHRRMETGEHMGKLVLEP